MGGGQGGWERRIEAFVNIQKKKIFFFFGGGGRVGGGSGWGVRVDVNGEVKFFVKIQKKMRGGRGRGGVGGPIRGWGRGGGVARFGVGG